MGCAKEMELGCEEQMRHAQRERLLAAGSNDSVAVDEAFVKIKVGPSPLSGLGGALGLDNMVTLELKRVKVTAKGEVLGRDRGDEGESKGDGGRELHLWVQVRCWLSVWEWVVWDLGVCCLGKSENLVLFVV